MTFNTVLIVDDNPTLLKKIQDIVIKAGYHVVTAQSGNEAIQKASQYSPVLVFLDIVMQGMDGYATCREIKKNNDIPVVFVSSKDQQTDLVWAQIQGGDGYITKPYSADEIVSSLTQFSPIPRLMTTNSILLVDDNETLLKQITEIVSTAGHNTITARNGKEALEKAEKFLPDLIFLDVMMPGMDGYATCRELKSLTVTKHIPVIFVSSKDQQMDVAWALVQGGHGYITKPFTASEVIQLIDCQHN